jgi:hypothetical protein
MRCFLFSKITVKPLRVSPIFFLEGYYLLFRQPPLEILALLGPFLPRLVHLVVQLVSDIHELVFGDIETAALAGVPLG